MEDVEWFSRLKKTKKFLILSEELVTSGRRIHRRGWIKLSLINLSLVALYQCGASSEALARYYYGKSRLID
jgi:hypothetical protein